MQKHTLANDPKFQDLVWDGIKGEQALKEKLSKMNYHVQKMCKSALNLTCAAVEERLLQHQFLTYKFIPPYLQQLCNDNPDISSTVQADTKNRFFRMFVGMPIAKYHGLLTIPVHVADCSFFRNKHYDGIFFNIVGKTELDVIANHTRSFIVSSNILPGSLFP